MKIDIAVVDYGMGNLRSVSKALEHVAPHKNVLVTSHADDILNAERVVFPGQGAMPDCIRELDARNLREAVKDAAANKPFLGICIGLQMLFEHSEEGNASGLGLIKGEVKKFLTRDMVALNTETQAIEKLKVPHMGWNEVYQTKPHEMWANIDNGARFYYVHSYYVAPQDQSLVAGTTNYPTPFTCAIANNNVFAVQFHPEKSATAGLQLLTNFVGWQP
jgi:imidazole glycerol-phosphate synthase subunit HisH